MPKQRILWIDSLRAVAMLFVVLGHASIWANAQELIYSFHMPLFFMISGMTFNAERAVSLPFSTHILRGARRLIEPYLWMQFLNLPLWALTFKVLSKSKIELVTLLPGIFYSNSYVFAVASSALWFLVALFAANLILTLLYKLTGGNRPALCALAAVCALIGFAERGVDLPWRLNAAFIAVAFLCIGRLFADALPRIEERLAAVKLPTKVAALALLAAVGVWFSFENGRISFSASEYGRSFVLFFVSAVAGSLFFVFLFMKLPNLAPMKYIGRNTLLYVGAHLPIMRLFEVIFPKQMNTPWIAFLFSLALFAALAPLCTLVNRCFPYIVGNGEYKESGAMTLGQCSAVYVALSVPWILAVDAVVSDGVSLFVSHTAATLALIPISVGLTLLFKRFCPAVFAKERQPRDKTIS